MIYQYVTGKLPVVHAYVSSLSFLYLHQFRLLLGSSLFKFLNLTHKFFLFICKQRCKLTVNDLIDARGVYLILGAQAEAFKRLEVLKREGRLFS